MADNKINTTITADSASYAAGLKQAVDATKQSVDQIKSHLGSLTEPFNQIKNAMLGIAALAAGGAVFKSFIDEALTASREVNLLKNSFGLTTAKADDLAFHLKRLGISTEEYVGMALKLDRQLRTGNETLAKMGFTARDVFLTQEQLMDKALKKILEYKPGIDRNIASMVLFGKSVQEVYPLLRTQIAGTKERSEELDKALNQSIDDDKLTIVKRYKIAMNELGLSFDAIKEAIGFAVMPYLTRFAEFITERAPTIVNSMKETTSKVINWAFDLAKSFLTVVSHAAVGLYNLAVIVEHLKVKFGWTTQEESDSFLKKFSDKVDALVEKIPGWKKRIEEFRNSVTSDSFKNRWDAMKGGDEPEEPKKGKSAAGLVKNDTAIKLAQENAREQMKAASDLYTFEAANINSLAQRFQISESQKTSMLLDALAQRHAAEEAAADRLIKLTQGNVVAHAKAKDQKLDLDRKYAIERQAIMNTQFLKERQEIANYVGAIESSWNGQLQGILAGTVSFGQAVKKVFADFVMYAIQQFEKKFIFEKLINALSLSTTTATETAKTAVVATGVTARTTAEEVGFTASISKTIGEALTSIGASVAALFAKLTEFFAFLGPAAPAAALGVALGVGAGAIAMISSIPKYEQGTPYVPNTGLAMLHKGEAVVPAGINAGGSGMNITLNVGALDAQSFGSYLKNGGGLQIAKQLGRIMRDNPSLT